jgi:hypothetical protein
MERGGKESHSAVLRCLSHLFAIIKCTLCRYAFLFQIILTEERRTPDFIQLSDTLGILSPAARSASRTSYENSHASFRVSSVWIPSGFGLLFKFESFSHPLFPHFLFISLSDPLHIRVRTGDIILFHLRNIGGLGTRYLRYPRSHESISLPFISLIFLEPQLVHTLSLESRGIDRGPQ